MPGVIPKLAAERQRANKPKSSAVLPAKGPRRRAPKLPDRWLETADGRVERPWHELTTAWWRDVWASPMAWQFEKADRHALVLLADVTDRYWWTGRSELLAEIRQMRRDFGLTPLDRRRLEWTIEDAAPERSTPAPTEMAAPEADPRRMLAVV